MQKQSNPLSINIIKPKAPPPPPKKSSCGCGDCKCQYLSDTIELLCEQLRNCVYYLNESKQKYHTDAYNLCIHKATTTLFKIK